MYTAAPRLRVCVCICHTTRHTYVTGIAEKTAAAAVAAAAHNIRIKMLVGKLTSFIKSTRAAYNIFIKHIKLKNVDVEQTISIFHSLKKSRSIVSRV